MKTHLLQWCAATLLCESHQIQVNPLGGDAGFRQYYRLQHGGNHYIATDAPVEHIDNHAFVDIARRLSAVGVAVPDIIAVDFQQGFLLQSDLGDALLLNQLNPDTVDDYYSQALAMIIQMQDANTENLPLYDAQLLQREMMLFTEWFIPKLLGVTLNDDESAMIDEVFKVLIEMATTQPQALVHRDFHSRNIHCLKEGLATIDFQDAVLGPITYDAVSLLKDCYIRWPANQVEQWFEDFYTALHNAGRLTPEANFPQMLEAFHAMGLQRHIKVLGIFARLSLRDNKHGYLLDLPLVIEYTLEATQVLAEKHPTFNAFHQWFTQRLSPIIAQQAWSHGR